MKAEILFAIFAIRTFLQSRDNSVKHFMFICLKNSVHRVSLRLPTGLTSDLTFACSIIMTSEVSKVFLSVDKERRKNRGPLTG